MSLDDIDSDCLLYIQSDLLVDVIKRYTIEVPIVIYDMNFRYISLSNINRNLYRKVIVISDDNIDSDYLRLNIQTIFHPDYKHIVYEI